MPQLSPKIKSLLSERVVENPSSTVCADDVDFVPDIEMPLVDTQAAEVPVGPDQSIIGEVCRELEDCEFSLDDELLRNSTITVELNRKLFQEQLQDVNRHFQESLELVGKDMHKQLLHELEKRRLDEMSVLVFFSAVYHFHLYLQFMHSLMHCRSLSIENWKHSILQGYRAEEEVS